jgi:hypothetical protein
MKNAIFLLSDPQRGGDDALGRLFNGLALAAESKKAGDDVAVVFAGPGTRWPAELAKLGHPARALYESVRDVVRGASCGCSEVFGAKASVEACEVPLLRDHALAGTSGVASLREYAANGYHTFIF